MIYFNLFFIPIILTEIISSIRVYKSYQKTKIHNLKYYAIIIFLLALFFLTTITPYPFISNLLLLQLFRNFSFIFIYLILAYSASLISYFIYKKTLPYYWFWCITLIGVIIFVYNLFYLEPAKIYYIKNFIFIEENRNEIIYFITGFLGILSSIIVSLLTFKISIKLKNKNDKLEGILVAISTFFDAIAVMSWFILKPFLGIFTSYILVLLACYLSAWLPFLIYLITKIWKK
jgi:hypothetical protein